MGPIMKRMLMGLFLIFLPLSPVRAEPNFPALTGRVVDNANVIPDEQEKILSKELNDFETQTKHQLVVVTIPTLGDYAISDYGYQLGRHWKIGRAGIDDGILLLQSTGEKKFRIEVGRGMEYILTDAKASEIIRNTLIATMKRNDLPVATKNATALTNGAREIMKLGAITPEQVAEWKQKEQAEAEKAAAIARDKFWSFFQWLFGIIALLSGGCWLYWFVTEEKRAIKKAEEARLRKEQREKEAEATRRYFAEREARDRQLREANAARAAAAKRQRDQMLAAMTPSQRKNFLDTEERRREESRQRAYQLAEQQRLAQEERERRRRQEEENSSLGGFTTGGWSSSPSSSSSSSGSDSFSGGGGDFGGGGADGDYS